MDLLNPLQIHHWNDLDFDASIIPVSGVEEALQLWRAHPEFITFGGRHSRRLEGFDFGNSPTDIEEEDFIGRTVVAYHPRRYSGS